MSLADQKAQQVFQYQVIAAASGIANINLLQQFTILPQNIVAYMMPIGSVV